MYIQVDTQTETYFFEAYSYRNVPVPPPQAGDPPAPNNRVVQISCTNGETTNCGLVTGDWVYVMNDTGKTINKFRI